jgi:hypothetical protein
MLIYLLSSGLSTLPKKERRVDLVSQGNIQLRGSGLTAGYNLKHDELKMKKKVEKSMYHGAWTKFD